MEGPPSHYEAIDGPWSEYWVVLGHPLLQQVTWPELGLFFNGGPLGGAECDPNTPLGDGPERSYEVHVVNGVATEVRFGVPQNGQPAPAENEPTDAELQAMLAEFLSDSIAVDGAVDPEVAEAVAERSGPVDPDTRPHFEVPAERQAEIDAVQAEAEKDGRATEAFATAKEAGSVVQLGLEHGINIVGVLKDYTDTILTVYSPMQYMDDERIDGATWHVARHRLIAFGVLDA